MMEELSAKAKSSEKKEGSEKEFREDFDGIIMAEIVRQYPNNRLPVLLCAMDEGRFGRAGNIRRCWVPEGTRAVVGKQYVREYEYMYTAVFPGIDKQDSLILPYVNTECMQKFIDYVIFPHLSVGGNVEVKKLFL